MKTKIQLAIAQTIGEHLVEKLAPYCHRIEIAGSIRRQKAEIGDIEIIAQAKPQVDLFGAPMEAHQLDTIDWMHLIGGTLIKGGHKYKQIKLPEDLQLDLFIVTPPAQWGVLFLIRTGPEEYSHRLVTRKSEGGLLPSYLRIKEGAVWSNNHIIETPEEQDVYHLIGIPYAEPWKREASWPR